LVLMLHLSDFMFYWPRWSVWHQINHPADLR